MGGHSRRKEDDRKHTGKTRRRRLWGKIRRHFKRKRKSNGGLRVKKEENGQKGIPSS